MSTDPLLDVAEASKVLGVPKSWCTRASSRPTAMCLTSASADTLSFARRS